MNVTDRMPSREQQPNRHCREGERGGGGEGEIRLTKATSQLSTLNSQLLLSLFTLLTSLFTFLPAPALAQPPANINIAEVHWGFGGTVMKERFAPLSLIVDNPSGEPFDGEIRLFRADALERRVGGYLVQPVFLASGTRRIVRFYPYVVSDADTWFLELGGSRIKLRPPTIAGQAVVLLTNQDSLFGRGGAIKHFPERLFPPLTTATDGLGAIVLDHIPDWEPSQRSAFLDWLRQGGTLHLLNSPTGGPPEFGADLHILNQPADSFFVGGGQVQRHSIRRAELTPAYVQRQIAPPDPDSELATIAVEDLEEAYQQQRSSMNYQIPLKQWSFQQRIFEVLKKIISPHHNWGMIHLLSLAYVVVLFPGCFLIGREYRRTPLTLAVILGSTILFGSAFYMVGNRGYGESTVVNGVSLARHIEGNRFDVTEWANLFVTNGGYYRLTNHGSDRIYSDATTTEAVGGSMIAGSEGRFIVDIPPFSSRIMARKAHVRIPASGPVTVSESDESTEVPHFALPPELAKEVIHSFVLIGDKAHVGEIHGGILIPGAPQPIPRILAIQQQYSGFRSFGFGLGNTEEEKPDLSKEQVALELVLYSLGVRTDDEFLQYQVPEGVARVYLYAPRPKNFAILASDATEPMPEANPENIGIQSGYVLYEYVIPL